MVDMKFLLIFTNPTESLVLFLVKERLECKIGLFCLILVICITFNIFCTIRPTFHLTIVSNILLSFLCHKNFSHQSHMK